MQIKSYASLTSLYRSVQIQARVIYALFMREIITRFGRHNIGFAWLFVEPMLFTGGIVLLWGATERSASHHISVVAFSLTSYPTALIWRNTIGRCTLAIEPNMSLLFHRNVRVLDIFLSRIILELVGVTIATITLLLIFMLVGIIPFPADVLTMVLGWFLLAWYATAASLLIGALSEFSEAVERIWHPLSYFQLPISGAFVMASWLPSHWRKLLLLFPVPNCVEIFRFGYFGSQITPYYNIPYTCTVNLVLTWLGLATVYFASKRVGIK